MTNLIPGFDEIKQRVSLNGLCDRLGMERRGASTWVCPSCGSGDGPNHSAAFSVNEDARYWHCFSCGAHGDCFDLVGIVHGVDGKLEQRAEVCALTGIPVFDAGGAVIAPAGHSAANAGGAGTAERPEAARAQMRPESEEITAFKTEQREYVRKCRQAFPGSDGEKYMATRGVSTPMCERWGLGWDERNRRVVMPYEREGWAWVARAVDGQKPKYVKPRMPGGLKMPALANTGEVEDARSGVLWVVEGYLDMLAVEAAGGRAVALIGRGNHAAIEGLAGAGALVIAALDSDGPGREANARLAGELREAGAWCVEAGPWPEGAKDAGELLERGRLDALAAHVKRVAEDELERQDRERREANERRLATLGVSDARSGMESICAREGFVAYTPTGLETVDAALGGGLPDGLTVLGATSSTGKTTLCVQVAEHAARAGRSVLYVSMEQGLLELAAKSLARAMCELEGMRVGTRELLSERERAGWQAAQEEALAAARGELESALGGRLRYMMPKGQPSVADIREAAALMADNEGCAPLVVVDYLQLLAPANDRQTEKQAVDVNVMGLRQLARDLRAPVLLISSLNRASYSGEVTMAAYKESGAIEYAADVLLGLQPADIAHEEDPARALREHKSRAIRECELAVLKNRNGEIPAEAVPLRFDAVACSFACMKRMEPLVV